MLLFSCRAAFHCITECIHVKHSMDESIISSPPFSFHSFLCLIIIPKTLLEITLLPSRALNSYSREFISFMGLKEKLFPKALFLQNEHIMYDSNSLRFRACVYTFSVYVFVWLVSFSSFTDEVFQW